MHLPQSILDEFVVGDFCEGRPEHVDVQLQGVSRVLDDGLHHLQGWESGVQRVWSTALAANAVRPSSSGFGFGVSQVGGTSGQQRKDLCAPRFGNELKELQRTRRKVFQQAVDPVQPD